MTPDPEKHYVISFSGGKDSVATWLYLTRELRLPRVTCTFADTGHEWPGLAGYLDLLEYEYGCPLVRIQPILEDVRGELVPEKIADRLGLDASSPDFWQQPLTMERLAIIKRRFPSTTVRFCTMHLKLIPMLRWTRESCDVSETVRVSGVRAEESSARASRPVWGDDELFGCLLWLPIHAWSVEQVFAIHAKYNVPPNPLYLNGCSRVGCFPCIMARKTELAQLSIRYPDESFGALKAMEDRVSAATGGQRSFFSKGKVPERYASHVDPKSGERFPDAEDVRRWALNEPPALSGQEMFGFEEDLTEDASMCLSMYGLCE